MYSGIFADAILVKSGHECNSKDKFLGHDKSASECAQRCKKETGCEFFLYGTRNTKCYMEKPTDTEINGQKCNGKDWVENYYNFYRRK